MDTGENRTFSTFHKCVSLGLVRHNEGVHSPQSGTLNLYMGRKLALTAGHWETCTSVLLGDQEELQMLKYWTL